MQHDLLILLLCLFAVSTLLAYPLGKLLYCVAKPNTLQRVPVLSQLEQLFYKVAHVKPDQEMNWKQYCLSLLLFSVISIVVLVLLQLTQGLLPLNPEHFAAVGFDTALNTAVSFVTNTNWQSYSGESTLGYLTQMLGLTVQNFASAAVGIAVLFALIRGLCQHEKKQIGNFWVDLTRISLYVLLPIAIIGALFFVSQGAIQNITPYVHFISVEGVQGVMPMGPNASQEVIKLLGTNGGGFFNANSAHPFSNPNYLTNFFQLVLMILLPMALCFTYGHMVNDRRHGWTIYSVMSVLLIGFVLMIAHYEMTSNPALQSLIHNDYQATLDHSGNLEGKESRFGVSASVLFSVITTATSTGAVNSMHDSLMPMGGFVPLFLMQTGEVIFGGVGSGLYGMIIMIILTVFIAGLMVGRTPEYLGKKIDAAEMKAVAAAMLIPHMLVLLGTAVAVLSPAALASISNAGPHGLSQILYALTSASNNNGSAFGGLNASVPFYNYLLALVMLIGRFGVIIPVLAIAGSMSLKKRNITSEASFPTNGLLFAVLLIVVILIFTALTYIPVLVLGPIIEHLQLFY